MSPAKKLPPVKIADDEEPSDSDEDVNLADVKLWRIIDFRLRGEWIDRHGTLLIKTFGVIVVTGFISFVAVRIWGR